MIRTSAFVASILAAAVLIGPASADDTKTSPPAGGPPVGKDAQGGKEGFGGKGEKGNRERGARGAERRNPEAWRKALEQTMPELTPETQEKVKAIRADFETQAKAWREANGDKMKALEEKMRAARAAGEGQKGGPDPALMKEMQELRASMPKPEDSQAKVWELLSPDQQAKFKERMDAAQKEMQQRRGAGKDGAKEGDRDPMLPGGERPKKRPDGGKPFNFEDKPASNPNGDGKPSGR